MSPIINIAKITKVIGSNLVFKDFSLDLHSGDRTMLLGANGVGKSTLLKMIVGLTRPDSGSIIRQFSQSDCGYVSHEPLIYGSMKVLEALELYRRFFNVSQSRYLTALKEFKLDLVSDRRVSSLSKGQQAKVGLLRALINNPKVLVFDEPTASLDDDSVSILRQHWLDSSAQVGGCAILATHDISRVQGYFNRVVVLGNNRILSDSRSLELQGERVDKACELSINLYRGVNR